MRSLIKFPSGNEARLPVDVREGLVLPLSTPLGSLFFKYLRVLDRVAHANTRLTAAHEHWATFRYSNPQIPSVHRSLEMLNAEEAIASMRRAADELIAIEGVLMERVKTGDYPTQIKPDSIGFVDRSTSPIFTAHERFLSQLNEVSNAHKHSFLQTSENIVGDEQPYIMAYPLTRNKLSASKGPVMISLDDFVDDFTAFLATAHEQIRALASRFRPFPEELPHPAESD